MLQQLYIENIAVIEKCRIDLSNGLNVLTGETGAGKSIIIDSLNTVLGERVSRDIVRTGAAFASVSALFAELSDKVINQAEELGFDLGDEKNLLFYRKITADGKNTCRINGKPATVAILKTLGKNLVNIHGQHDSQALLQSEKHLGFIDLLLEDNDILEKYQVIYQKMCQFQKELKELQMDDAEKERRIDLLKYQIDEIQQAEIREGEMEELLQQKHLLANGEKIIQELNEVYQILYGLEDFPGICEQLSNCSNLLSDAAHYDMSLETLSNAISDTTYDIQEYTNEIRDKIDNFDFDEQALADTEERLDLLYRLRKKYGYEEKDILAYLDNAVKELEEITMSEERIVYLEQEYLKCYDRAQKLAVLLSEQRQRAARQFSEKIMEELHYLDMPKAVFMTHIKPVSLSCNGIDGIEFLISVNPGEAPKPLAKVASGGELSRIMLAIKNVLADKDDVGTLIFDEIDTGVSGRAAQKIGLKLRQAAKNRQIICVTHSAQIAVQAHQHMLIEKKIQEQRTFTIVRTLDLEGRKQEIARIMGGLEITDLQLKSAEEMLKNAQSST